MQTYEMHEMPTRILFCMSIFKEKQPMAMWNLLRFVQRGTNTNQFKKEISGYLNIKKKHKILSLFFKKI